ncbi:MAG: TolC family protein [Verrucomicrobiota bacterium]
MSLRRKHLLFNNLVALAFAVSSMAAEPWTLERSIRHALTNSPDARIAEKRIRAARAGIEQANAALWPQVQLQSSYTRTDNPMRVFGAILNQRAYSPALDFNDVPDVDHLNVRGVVTQPLYTGGRIAFGRKAARASRDAAQATALAVQNLLAFEVARNFHNVVRTHKFIRAADAGVRAFESNLIIASNRVTAGTALKTEWLDFEVRLAQAREDLARARHAHALARHALGNLLGLDPGQNGSFTVAESDSTPAAPESSDEANRPELLALQHQKRAAEARVGQARAGYRPRISAFASMDYDYGWRTEGDGRNYTAGLMVEWDLWDGKRTHGRVAEAEADLDIVREEERKLLLAIRLEAEQAQLQFIEATERMAVTDAAVGHAAESVRLTRSRFEQGLAIATQLIDAETALITARVRRAEAEADRRIAIAAWRRALGLPQLPADSQSR